MTEHVTVKVDSKKFEEALRRFPAVLKRALKRAGMEAGAIVLDSQGIRLYPPEGKGNREPFPYWERGYGMRYASGKTGKMSERYGTSWHVKARYGSVLMSTKTSYAQYVGGEKQSKEMHDIGWRKVIDVAKQKIQQISGVYGAWVMRALKQVGLK